MIKRLTDEPNDTRFKDSCIHVDTLDHIPRQKIIETVGQSGFCCLRGLIDEYEVKIARQAFQMQFSTANDKPGVGEKPKDIQHNFQKVRVGISPLKPENSRLLRTFYNPLWESDIYRIHALYQRMITVRNTLLGVPLGFASNTIENGLMTAARIHQYPRGGGFMSAHRDELIIDVAADAGINFFQVLMIMSKKGVDYHSGGGFVIRDGMFIDIEINCQLGDIIIYDGNTLHGVDTIDPDRVLDMNTPSGRLAAFVTLYRSEFTPAT